MNDITGPRAAIDTNLVVSGLIVPSGYPGQLLAAWEHRAFRLILSRDLLPEMSEVRGREHLIRRFRVSRQEVERLLTSFARRSRPVAPLDLPSLPVQCRDRKDDMLLACAWR